MKEDWEILKIEDLGNLFSGNSINKKTKEEKYTNIEDGLPYIATKDIGYDRTINYENGVRIPESDISSFRVATKNSILICAEGGSAGRKIGITNQDVCLVNKLFALSIKENIDPKYVFFFYQSDSFQKDFKSKLTGLIGGVSKSKFKDIQIPLPPLPDQKAIVKILDEAFAKINQAKANIEKNIENAKELFQSKLNEILNCDKSDYDLKTLSDISIEFGRGKSKHRPRGDESLYGGDFPLIQTGDIGNSNHLINNYSKTYNKKGIDQSKLWKEGTVCIAIVGANVGESGILNFDSCFPDSVIGIAVDKSQANNEYVEYLIQSIKGQLKEMGKGTARDNINMGTFKGLKLPFPPIDKQKVIIENLNDLSERCFSMEKIFKKKLNNIEELKKSLLQKAFSGELTKSEAIA